MYLKKEAHCRAIPRLWLASATRCRVCEPPSPHWLGSSSYLHPTEWLARDPGLSFMLGRTETRTCRTRRYSQCPPPVHTSLLIHLPSSSRARAPQFQSVLQYLPTPPARGNEKGVFPILPCVYAPRRRAARSFVRLPARKRFPERKPRS